MNWQNKAARNHISYIIRKEKKKKDRYPEIKTDLTKRMNKKYKKKIRNKKN